MRHWLYVMDLVLVCGWFLQIKSETGFSSPNSLKEFGTAERVEFQMHGQAGPDSYKFGYDTGEGKNRQFRYEEKDNAGNVKGQYGYYDKEGKLKIYNYQADSNGFRSQPL